MCTLVSESYVHTLTDRLHPYFPLIPTLTEMEEVQIPQALYLPGGVLIPAAGQLWQSGEAEGRLSLQGCHSVSQRICKCTHNVGKKCITEKSGFSYHKIPVQPWATHSVSVFLKTWSVIYGVSDLSLHVSDYLNLFIYLLFLSLLYIVVIFSFRKVDR